MRSGLIVIRDVVGKEPSLTVFAEDDDVAQTLSLTEPLSLSEYGFCQGAIRCREHFLDTHVLDPPSKLVTIDSIPVAKDILRRGVPRKGFYYLLCRPCRSPIFRYCEIEVNDPTACDRQKTQHI
jgi:hypothetical protein